MSDRWSIPTAIAVVRDSIAFQKTNYPKAIQSFREQRRTTDQ